MSLAAFWRRFSAVVSIRSRMSIVSCPWRGPGRHEGQVDAVGQQTQDFLDGLAVVARPAAAQALGAVAASLRLMDLPRQGVLKATAQLGLDALRQEARLEALEALGLPGGIGHVFHVEPLDRVLGGAGLRQLGEEGLVGGAIFPGQEVRVAEQGPHVGRDLVLPRRLLDGLVPVPVLPGDLSGRSDEVFVGHGRRSGPPLRRRGRPLSRSSPLILGSGAVADGGVAASAAAADGELDSYNIEQLHMAGARRTEPTHPVAADPPGRSFGASIQRMDRSAGESDLARNVAPGSGTNALRAGEGQTSWRDATPGLRPPGPVRRPGLRRLGMRGALLKSVEKALVA